MAAFTHLNPDGSRFSDGRYGVFYAARSLDTAVAETMHHRANFMAATSRGAADPEGYATRIMAYFIHREALVMAIADAFLILTVIFLLSAIIPLFMKKPGTFAGPPPDAH